MVNRTLHVDCYLFIARVHYESSRTKIKLFDDDNEQNVRDSLKILRKFFSGRKRHPDIHSGSMHTCCKLIEILGSSDNRWSIKAHSDCGRSRAVYDANIE